MAVSLRVTGAWAELTADGTVAIPATPQAGDRMYLFARWKDFSITASVANWTEVTQFADGATSSGNGTGSVKVACWYRDWQSGDSNPTIDFSSSPTNASVVIMVMQKGADDVWDTPLFRTAAMTNWTTSSQSVSASSTLAVPSGSVVMGLIGIRDDTATMTRPTNGIDDSGGAITWAADYVESPATHHSTTTGDDGAADLGYRLVSLGATATLRMTGTISAAETGAALWVIQDVTVVVTPAPVTITISSFAPTLKTAVTPSSASITITSFAPTLKFAVTPTSGSITIAGFSLTLLDAVTPTPTSIIISSFAPTLASAVTPSPATITITGFAPTTLPFKIIFLDPGGDGVNEVNYFAVASGTNTPAFDTSQKVNGVGSYKFDSGVGNGNSYNKVAGILGQSRRISFYFRYDSLLNTDAISSDFPTGNGTTYSGGGFVTTLGDITADDGFYATAIPAKNGGQGNILTGFSDATPPTGARIDAVKLIYERKYDIATSAGISRIKWRFDGVEGPNHDNTDMPTTDTVVTIDVTLERTWEIGDFATLEVIAEARRGDSDIVHVQSWDYVKVQVGYHTPIEFLRGYNTVSDSAAIRLQVLPSGAGLVFRLAEGGGDVFTFDGITIIPPDEDHRITLSYLEHGVNDLDVNLYIDGFQELSIVGMNTGGLLSTGDSLENWPDLLYGWVSQPGASKVCWIDQLYIDEGNDLLDPGPIFMTAKLPASVNQDNFDTTGGTGAVDERPVSLTNFKQQAGSSQQHQNYTLQADSAGDIDISGEVLIGHMGWAIVKRTGPGGGSPGLMLNGTVTGFTIPTTASLIKVGMVSDIYPSDAAGIGARSFGNTTDFFLYECGAIVAYQGPVEDILFARYLLLAESSAEVVDDLRASPPNSYLLRYSVTESGGSVLFTVYCITADGESPQLRTQFEASQGSGTTTINTPGIEVRVVMTVTGADTYVAMQRYLNV